MDGYIPRCWKVTSTVETALRQEAVSRVHDEVEETEAAWLRDGIKVSITTPQELWRTNTSSDG